MIDQKRIAGLLLLAVAVAACSPKQASKPPPTAPSPPPAPADGSPRIVDSADGVHIEYHVYGAGDPAILLIHCWSCDSSYWSAQIAPLKASYTTVTLDLAGHGASGRNRTDWTMGNSERT